jgi:thiol-disulfide isomerase/thioredoxin
MTRPACFSSANFADALSETKSFGKLLLVDATASWCGPCKVMDQITWVDAKVVDWLSAHGTAIQIDVDEEKELAARLKIRAMPTVIVFRDGVEFDRSLGLKKPDELIGWLEGVLRGETTLSQAKKTATEQPKNMMARLDFARTMLMSGKLDEATEEFVWLWQHVVEHEPGMSGVRVSFMANDLAQLTQQHPPAKARLSALRDELTELVESNRASAEHLQDWVVLNEALGEQDRFLAWFDRVRDTYRPKPEDHWVLEQKLIPMLIERKRWADAGRLFLAPLQVLRRHQEMFAHPPEYPGMPEEMRTAMLAQLKQFFVDRAARLHVSLKAAGRLDDAKAVLDEARKLMPGEHLEQTITHTLSQAGLI